MLDELTRDTFARWLNTHFRVEAHGASALTLELIEVGELRSTPGSESFSIVFRGPADAFLPQAIYQFHHDAIGAFELFVVPIGKDTDGFYYEAVFNRMRRENYA
jgi:Domain of unknown function (DUF6916)